MLYKEGPAFYHASYVVIIDVLDKTLKRKEEFNLRSMEVTNIIGLNRLCETAGKVYCFFKFQLLSVCVYMCVCVCHKA